MRYTAVFLGVLWVFGVSVSYVQCKGLKCIVGETVTFPAAVSNIGFLIKDGSITATVSDHNLRSYNESFRGRLQWDSSTGLFSITGLKMEDSGEYKVQGNETQTYQLIVFNPVSTPQVSSRNKMKPTCSVLCSVENGREVTLSWQREGETLNHTSSPDLNTPLSLPLEIEEYNSTYSCVAANPVSNKTVTVRPEEYCFEPVSKPRITNTTAAGSRGRCCSVLCSVENRREVTLSWQREGETLNHTSSPDLNTPLSLPLEIEEYNYTYSCVAANPVSEDRSNFNISELCDVKCSDHSDQTEHKVAGLSSSPLIAGIGAGAALLFVILTVTAIYLKRMNKSKGSADPPCDVTYADINHRARKTQTENGQKRKADATDDVVYSSISHKHPAKQRTTAHTVTQGEDICVYAEVRR